MEAFNLYKNGFIYNHTGEDNQLLKQLDQDYIQQSDLDLLLDDLVREPINEDDIYYLATFDIASILSARFPMFAKRLNVPAIGKKMVERGFISLRKSAGGKKISCFEVSSSSTIRNMIDGYNGGYNQSDAVNTE